MQGPFALGAALTAAVVYVVYNAYKTQSTRPITEKTCRCGEAVFTQPPSTFSPREHYNQLLREAESCKALHPDRARMYESLALQLRKRTWG